MADEELLRLVRQWVDEFKGNDPGTYYGLGDDLNEVCEGYLALSARLAEVQKERDNALANVEYWKMVNESIAAARGQKGPDAP